MLKQYINCGILPMKISLYMNRDYQSWLFNIWTILYWLSPPLCVSFLSNSFYTIVGRACLLTTWYSGWVPDRDESYPVVSCKVHLYRCSDLTIIYESLLWVVVCVFSLLIIHLRSQHSSLYNHPPLYFPTTPSTLTGRAETKQPPILQNVWG